VVWPVRVQGETAGAEVAAAVRGFNELQRGGAIPRPDVLIVARGGGSLEDLWGFNDEAVARAAAASDIPLISAVGHETDWTLIDFVADVRAPTPTGAAELAVPVKAELAARIANLSARLQGAAGRSSDRKRQALRAASRALPSADQLLAQPRRRIDDAASRLGRALTANTEKKHARYRGLRLSPATLARRVGDARQRTARAGVRLPNVFLALVSMRRTRFDRDAARVTPGALLRRTRMLSETASALGRRSDQAARLALKREGSRLEQAWRLAGTLSYQSVLARGFAVVKDAGGKVIRQAASIASGDVLDIEFADGKVAALAGGGAAKVRAASRPKPGSGQGSLF
jgi:exodeoxyribonuclease VII large subunit